MTGLRVCFVSSYPPNRGRLSEYAQSLLKELANRPAVDKVFVLVDTVDGSTGSLGDGSKVEVLRVWKADNSFSILGIVPRILKLKPDVVHFNVHFQSYGRSRLANFIGLSSVFLCRLLGLRVVVSVHNLGEKVNLEKVGLKASLLNKVGILFATKLLLSAPTVVVTVNSYAAYLRRRYGHKRVMYIPHGASVHACSPVDPSEKVVLMFGHMGPSKGVPVMLAAFEQLRKEMSGVKLVVAGSSHPNFPGYLAKFVKASLPKVDFLGYVEEKDLPRVFGLADVVVLPYLATTGTSGVFHLACGYGKPIVSSDLPEIRELVAEGASALLVPPGNVGALKDGLLKVLSNGETVDKMGEQNLLFAQREQWDIVAEAYEAAYLELVGS